MTPDEAVSEYHRVIAEYDRLHAPCPIEQRQRQRVVERQQRREQEVRKSENQAMTQAQWHEWFLQELNAAFLDKENCAFIEAVGQCLGETRQQLRKDCEVKIAVLETRLKDLERQAELNQQFLELERRLGARQLARDKAKRGSDMIPHSELVTQLEKLQRQVNNLGSVADLDGRFREFAERVCVLEKTNGLEARFTKLANEVKGRSEIPQGELLEKIEGLQCQINDLKMVAGLDACFGELVERVDELGKTTSLEARFTKLAHEVKRGSELPQSELLPRIVELERRLDDFTKIAKLPGPQGPPGQDGKLPIVKSTTRATS